MNDRFNSGFSGTGIFIVVFSLVICLAVYMKSNSNSNITVGWNGIVETRCINGYMFIVGQDGSVRQVIDSFGKGARCDVQEVKP